MKILIIHNQVATPDRSGSDARLLQIIDSFIALGHMVTFVALKFPDETRYVNELHAKGIRTYVGDAEELALYGKDYAIEWSFHSVLSETQFDLALLTLWFWDPLTVPEHYLNTLRILSPNTWIGVLTDDRHSLRQRQIASGTNDFLEVELVSEHAQRERDAYRNSDFVLTIAEAERQNVTAIAPAVPAYVVPFTATINLPETGYADRSGFVFLANFLNAAARDAADFLLTRVFPLIRQSLPQVTLTFAGLRSQEWFGTQTVSGVESVGYIDDLKAFFSQKRVFVSPMRRGTGIVTKNVTALSFGLPLVTSTVGAQSLSLRHGVNALLADSANDFAQCAVAAYTQRSLWEHLSRGALAFIQESTTQSLSPLLRQILSQFEVPPQRTLQVPHWSSREVDQQYPYLQTHSPIKQRMPMRFYAYLLFADKHLSDGLIEAALEQYRHALSFYRYRIQNTTEYSMVLQAMEHCYHLFNDTNAVKRCAVERDRLIELLRTPLMLTSASNSRYYAQIGGEELKELRKLRQENHRLRELIDTLKLSAF